jgi:hypothetical protein
MTGDRRRRLRNILKLHRSSLQTNNLIYPAE